MALLRALQNDGVSVLMTTHHRPLIELADRRLRLDAGHLVSA
jgi:ABC-type ATPase involved in cell division